MRRRFWSQHISLMSCRSLALGLTGYAMLVGCDRAISDRYGGLVVAPIQEVILIEDEAEQDDEFAANSLPAPRPAEIPARAADLSPVEIEDTDLDVDLALNTPVPDPELPLVEDVIIEDPLEIEVIDSVQVGLLNPDEAYVPEPRPNSWPASFENLEAFLIAQAEAEEAARLAEEERLAEEARLLAAQEEAARQAEAERLAALEAEQEAERLAAESAASVTQATTAPLAVRAPRSDDLPSLLLPLSYEDGVALSTPEELKTFYADQAYDLTRVIAGSPVPGLILQRLPKDLGELNSTDRALLKEIYIKAALPLCLVANERVLIERAHVLSREDVREDLSQAIDPAVRGLAAKYNTDSRSELLKRLDTVPVSLCLAQAILESRWGLSDLTTDHNALFGPWAIAANEGPLSEVDLDPDQVLTFASLQASTDAYVLYLNRSDALAQFREDRADAMMNGLILSGQKAAAHIQAFDSETPNYSTLILRLIEENELDQYDLARLSLDRTAVPVL